jgi:renalase
MSSAIILAMTKTIAVVGAGVSGAVCARHLASLGHSVQVFDKGRGLGGRTSSRRTNSGHRFDHGAARIDVSQPAVHELLEPALRAGLLCRLGDIYTSPSGLNALCKSLLDGLPAQYSTKLIRLEHDKVWKAFDEHDRAYGPFDAVVLAVPPVNAAEIVIDHDAELAKTISCVRMLPCWVVMLGFSEWLDQVPDHSMVNGQILRRSMSNSAGDALLIEASQGWSIEHIEMDVDSVGTTLLEMVRSGLGLASPTSIDVHRWRYAFADTPLGRPYLAAEHELYVCGDWCLGRSIEPALLSALAVVDALSRS